MTETYQSEKGSFLNGGVGPLVSGGCVSVLVLACGRVRNVVSAALDRQTVREGRGACRCLWGRGFKAGLVCMGHIKQKKGCGGCENLDTQSLYRGQRDAFGQFHHCKARRNGSSLTETLDGLLCLDRLLWICVNWNCAAQLLVHPVRAFAKSAGSDVLYVNWWVNISRWRVMTMTCAKLHMFKAVQNYIFKHFDL